MSRHLYRQGRHDFLKNYLHELVLILPPSRYIITNADQEPVGQPDWATDGSFLVFRKLKQLVPEFNK